MSPFDLPDVQGTTNPFKIDKLIFWDYLIFSGLDAQSPPTARTAKGFSERIRAAQAIQLNSPSSSRASRRSFVSKPSVNEP